MKRSRSLRRSRRKPSWMTKGPLAPPSARKRAAQRFAAIMHSSTRRWDWSFSPGLDVIDVTSLVQHPAKLLPVVHHQFLFLAVPAQGARGLVERLEGRGVAYQRFVVAAEVAVDGVVGELRAGANLRLEKAEIADGAVLSHLQATYQRRPRLVFRQRTAAQGQGLGKHRRHGAVEVHAAAAPAHDIAQGRAGVDVGRRVGDGDGEYPPLGGHLGVQRIVDVLRACGVDGDEGEIAEILALRVFQGRALAHRAVEGTDVALGPIRFETVLGHDVAVLDARIVAAANTFQHLGLRLAIANRVALQGAAQVVALADALARLRGQEQPARQPLDVRLDEQGLALAHAASREFRQGTVDEALDFRHRPLVLRRSHDHGHAVPGEGLEHFVRWYEHLAAVIQAHEPVARRGAADHALGALLLRFHLLLETLQLGQRLSVEHGGRSQK
jgi:hypothetical protein